MLTPEDYDNALEFARKWREQLERSEEKEIERMEQMAKEIEKKNKQKSSM